MGYCFEGRKVYDDRCKNLYHYRLTDMDLKDLEFMNVSLWYDNIVEEAERCLDLVTGGKEFVNSERSLQLLSTDMIEEYIKGSADSVKVSPFASSVMILYEIKDLYIGYCHHVMVSKPGSIGDAPVRVHFGRFQMVNLRFDGAVVSIKNIHSHMCSGGYLKLKDVVIQEYEDGISATELDGMTSDIEAGSMSTHRCTADIPLMLDYAYKLGISTLSLYDTEEIAGLNAYLDHMLEGDSDRHVYVKNMKNPESVYNSIVSTMEFVEKLSGFGWGKNGLVYKDMCYKNIILVQHDYKGINTGLYKYKNRQFIFMAENGKSGLYMAYMHK